MTKPHHRFHSKFETSEIMHLTTTLIPFFAALACAFPITESTNLGPSTSEHAPLVPSHHSPSTLDMQHPSDSTIFTVQAFQAWVTSSPAEGKPNWASFYVSTSDSQSYTCSFVTVQPVLSATAAWECEGAGGGPKDKMWFKFSPGFNEMELQRSKESKG
jgi:hypothetical protein